MSISRCAAFALALLVTACAGDRPAPFEAPTGDPSGSMNIVTALVDGVEWNSGAVTVRQGGGLMFVQATAWPNNGDERQYLTLTFETTSGTTAQAVGVDRPVSASLGIEFIGGWIASGGVGSGTITLTSLTPQRAVGTFAFSGNADGPVSPPVLVVKNGRFDVRLP